MMKTVAVVLVVAVGAVLGAAPVGAALITPTVVDFSSQEPDYGGRLAVYTTDGSGIIGYLGQTEVTATSVHEAQDGPNGDMWHSDYVAGVPHIVGEYLTFDLGALTDLATIYIWQFGRNGVEAENSRGMNSYNIFVSSDSDFATASFTDLGSFSLAKHGVGDVSAQSVDVAGLGNPATESVRLVKLVVNSNHGETMLVGLAEVRFEPVPEPATLALLGLGLAGAGLLRRRRK